MTTVVQNRESTEWHDTRYVEISSISGIKVRKNPGVKRVNLTYEIRPKEVQNWDSSFQHSRQKALKIRVVCSIAQWWCKTGIPPNGAKQEYQDFSIGTADKKP